MKKHKRKILTVSILATLSTVAIHIINKLIIASATIKNLLHADKHLYFDWKFGKIHYSKQGSGSPILLIHDIAPASSGYEWQHLTDSLSATHTVYTIDLLGCGRSDKPKITYTNFLYVQLITDFVKTIIGKKTNVIASGLSSSFTIMTCLNDEDVFNKIMLINPEDLAVLTQIPTKKSKAAKFLIELPVIGTLLYNILTSKVNTELLFTEKYLHNPFHTEQNSVDVYYESAHKENDNGKYLLSSIIGKYIYCNVSHALKKIDNSIFLVGGESKDGIQETLALYRSLNKAVEAEIIPKTKQLPQMEAPEQLLELIRIFF